MVATGSGGGRPGGRAVGGAVPEKQGGVDAKMGAFGRVMYKTYGPYDRVRNALWNVNLLMQIRWVRRGRVLSYGIWQDNNLFPQRFSGYGDRRLGDMLI